MTKRAFRQAWAMLSRCDFALTLLVVQGYVTEGEKYKVRARITKRLEEIKRSQYVSDETK